MWAQNDAMQIPGRDWVGGRGGYSGPQAPPMQAMPMPAQWAPSDGMRIPTREELGGLRGYASQVNPPWGGWQAMPMPAQAPPMMLPMPAMRPMPQPNTGEIIGRLFGGGGMGGGMWGGYGNNNGLGPTGGGMGGGGMQAMPSAPTQSGRLFNKPQQIDPRFSEMIRGVQQQGGGMQAKPMPMQAPPQSGGVSMGGGPESVWNRGMIVGGMQAPPQSPGGYEMGNGWNQPYTGIGSGSVSMSPGGWGGMTGQNPQARNVLGGWRQQMNRSDIGSPNEGMGSPLFAQIMALKAAQGGR